MAAVIIVLAVRIFYSSYECFDSKGFRFRHPFTLCIYVRDGRSVLVLKMDRIDDQIESMIVSLLFDLSRSDDWLDTSSSTVDGLARKRGMKLDCCVESTERCTIDATKQTTTKANTAKKILFFFRVNSKTLLTRARAGTVRSRGSREWNIRLHYTWKPHQ